LARIASYGIRAMSDAASEPPSPDPARTRVWSTRIVRHAEVERKKIQQSVSFVSHA
jgi:hypothetical protein